MKIYDKCCALLLLLLLAGCTHKQSDQQIPNRELQGTLLTEGADFYGSFPRIIVNDLWYMSAYSDSVAMCVNRLSNDTITTVEGLFRIGPGPKEVRACIPAKGVDDTMTVINYNPAGGNLISFIRTPIVPCPPQNIDDMTIYPADTIKSFLGGTSSLAVMSDSTIMVPGAYYFTEHIFSVINIKNQKITPLTFWPDDDTQAPAIVKQAVYAQSAQIFRSGNKYLYNCNNASGQYAFIFTLDGNKVNVIKELFSEKPRYKVWDDGINYTPVSTDSRLFVDATTNRIYAQTIDLDINGKVPDDPNYRQCGNKILVFDWDGNAIESFTLSKPGFIIKADPDDRYLYLFTLNAATADNEIWKYNLQ